MYKKCIENKIFLKIFYKCHLCDCKMGKDFESVSTHLATDLHTEKFKKIAKERENKQPDKLLELSESELEQIVTNSITFDMFSNSFYCHICKTKMNELYHTFEHIKDTSHQIVLKNTVTSNLIARMNKKKVKTSEFGLQSESNCITFDEINDPTLLTSTYSSLKSDFIIYDEKCDSYYCTICKCKFVSTLDSSEDTQECLSQAIVEVSNALRNTRIESSKEETNLQENSLRSCISEIYCCTTCQAFLEDSIDVQYHVMLHLFKEFQLLNNFDVLEFNFGTDDKFYLKCLLCDFECFCKMSDAHEFLKEHFRTNRHLQRSIFFKHTKNCLGLDGPVEQINSLDLKKFTYNAVKSIHLLKHPCNQHDLAMSREKQEVQKHVAIIETKTGFDSDDLHYYKCFMCHTSFYNVSKLFDHYKTPEHKSNIEAFKISLKCLYTNFITLSPVIFIGCSLCNQYFNDLFITMEHIQGRKHNHKVSFVSINQQKAKNLETLKPVINNMDDLNVRLSKKLVKEPKKITTLTRTQSPTVIITKNLEKIKKESNEVESSEELNQMNFSTEIIHPVPVPLPEPNVTDNVLDDLVSLDFNRYQIRKLPRHAKPKSAFRSTVENQKTLYATNVLEYGKTFVKFCIDPGFYNIYNLNKEAIILMDLGVTFTFAQCSNRVCIPCRKSFPADVQSLFEHLQNPEHIKIMWDIVKIDYEEFGTVPDKFSDLRLARLYMYPSGQLIQCHACNIKIKDNDDIIRQHAKIPFHEEKSKLWKADSEQLYKKYWPIHQQYIWYYADKFFCAICQVRYKFEIEFAMHLIHQRHVKNVMKYKANDLKFDLCPSCITYWFGKYDYYKDHCQTDIHKRLVESKDFMVPKMTMTATEYLDNIEKNVDLLISDSDKLDLEKDRVTALLHAIEETVKSTHPNAKAYVFGSRLSHLGFPDSDVDVYLDCDNLYFQSSTTQQSQERMGSIKNYFESAPNSWIVDENIIDTRVPIMKLRHIPTNLKCDISFINGLTVDKSKLVGIYNRAFPICRKLILFMKKWLTLCRIFGSDYITTFAISWCVIFYLQIQGILPSVHELVTLKNKSKIVDGWECGFQEIIEVESSDLSFKEHLKGFFTYFANFDYQKSVVCPYLGKAVDKHYFAYTEELPSEMDVYKRRLRDNEVEIFRFDSPMCIQDPIDLSQNLTKALKKQHLRCFGQYCTLSAERC